MWSVGLFPVADTCERVSDSVGGSRNKRLAERLALCSVYKYLSPFKWKSLYALRFWRMKNRAKLGGRICPVREAARNGWYLLLCLITNVMRPYRTGDALLIFRTKTSPALERARRKNVPVFRDLTPCSLVFYDVSKESAFISRGWSLLGPWSWRCCVLSKRRGNVIQRHSVTSQKIWILNVAA
jgi:hypothetical protein